MRCDLEKELRQALDRHLDDRVPDRLSSSIRYSLFAAGKRIRPRMLLATSEMLNLSPSQAVPAAVAIEMIHCFTLIHDDLPCMDNDDYRRGQLSNHKQYDEATALLAGDSLMALACEEFSRIASYTENSRFFGKAFQRFLESIGPRGVIAGQAAEMELTRENSSLNRLRAIHRLKTGALFRASILIPMDLCGMDPKSKEGVLLHSFGESFGLAFQIADDLADHTHDPQSGRNVFDFSSSENPSQQALAELRNHSEQLEKIWGDQSRSLTKISEELQSVLRSSNANLHHDTKHPPQPTHPIA